GRADESAARLSAAEGRPSARVRGRAGVVGLRRRRVRRRNVGVRAVGRGGRLGRRERLPRPARRGSAPGGRVVRPRRGRVRGWSGGGAAGQPAGDAGGHDVRTACARVLTGTRAAVVRHAELWYNPAPRHVAGTGSKTRKSPMSWFGRSESVLARRIPLAAVE